MVTLVPMTEEEFSKWLEPSVKEYAADKVRAGNEEEAGSLERAQQEFRHYLPDGIGTKDHHLYSIVDEKRNGQRVGVLWFGELPRGPRNTLFLFDIHIREEDRGKGYGSAALELFEDKARELGKSRVGLHVFGHNVRARKLYEELGYKVTNVNMAKDV